MFFSVALFGKSCSGCQWEPNNQRDSGDNRTSSSGCPMYWCCVLARFCSTEHQGAYADPAHQPLLVIFCEEKNSSNVKGWEWHSTKSKQSSTLYLSSNQSQVKQERRGGESTWATWQHNKPQTFLAFLQYFTPKMGL